MSSYNLFRKGKSRNTNGHALILCPTYSKKSDKRQGWYWLIITVKKQAKQLTINSTVASIPDDWIG